MRTIVITEGDTGKDLLVEIAKQPIGGLGRGAISLDQIRLGIRLLDKLDASTDGKIELEDTEWAHLCEKIKAFPFAMVDARIVSVCDAVLNA